MGWTRHWDNHEDQGLCFLILRCVLTMSNDNLTSAVQITSWAWRCLSSGQMRCCSIFGTRMRYWQNFQALQHSSLAHALLCAVFWSPLRLRSLLSRIPLPTPGKTASSGLRDASWFSVCLAAVRSCGFWICIPTGSVLACRLKDKPELCEQVKFFVAKPLIASNGYHMGSL